MKLLVISKYYYPFFGGIEENVKQIAEYCAKFISVTVLASNVEMRDARETINNVSIIRKKRFWEIHSQPINPSFFSGIRLSTFDVVHFHSPNPIATIMFLAKFALSPRRPALVVTHHMDIHGRRTLRLVALLFIKLLMRIADAVIVTSEKNRISSDDLPSRANYVVVPLSLHPELYDLTPQLRHAAVEWRRSVGGDAPLVGFVGRHARYKGLDVLLDALVKLPGVKAVVAGDGPYRAKLMKRAEDLGLADRVSFPGMVDHETKLKILAAIDVFAFPSTEKTEAFGIAQMEAMLCGAPVVASDLPTGVTDVAIDRVTALTSPPGDADALAQRIDFLLKTPDVARALGATGRRHILENMTSEVVNKKVLALFESVYWKKNKA